MRVLSSIRLQKESFKNRIALIVKLSVIVIPAFAIYWQDMELVFREALVNDFMNYILILPFLIGYIIYRKMKVLKAVLPLTNHEQEKLQWKSQVIIGISSLSVSFLTYFLGSYTSYALEYHLLSFPLFVAGGIALVFNLETLKTLSFAIVLLFFIQPYLIQLANPFWSDLSWISSTTAYNFLSVMGIPAKFTTVLDVPTIEILTKSGEMLPFTVGVASSGLNSFMGFTLFALFVVYILKEPLWKRVTLMLIGYPLLILLNTLRITIILSLAYHWGNTVAEIFHLTGGMVLIFIGTTLLLLIGEKIWKVRMYPTKPALTNCAYCNKSLTIGSNFCVNCGKLLKSINHVISKQSTLKMTLLILLASLFLIIQTPPIVLAKPPTEIDLKEISAQESKLLLPSIPGWDLEFLYRDTRVESILSQDAALVLAYVSRNNGGNSSYAYVYVGVQVSVGRHTWEASLITYPARYGRPTATVLDLRDIQILQNPTLTARIFAYQRPKSNVTEVVLYWFERVPFKIGSIWDVRNVQISLWCSANNLATSGLISNPSDFAGVEKVYLPIAKDIANYWQPIKTSSQITAMISRYGDKMASATSILISVLIAGAPMLYGLERRKEKRANANAYQKLSKPNKQVIDIVRQTEKATTPTLNAIATEYQSTTGKTIQRETLLKKLGEAEKAGLIKSDIVSVQDEPIQTWKIR